MDKLHSKPLIKFLCIHTRLFLFYFILFLDMRSYLRTTVEFCRDKGYVQTINGRRRYLPSITSTQPYSRAHVSW